MKGKTNLLYKGFKGIKDLKSIHTCGFGVEIINFNEINNKLLYRIWK